MEDSVNSQITDSVSQLNTFIVGSAAPQSLGIVDVSSAEALSMFMYNAVSSQHNAQISSSAATTATCARILQAKAAPPAPAKSPDPHVPPPFMPLNSGTSAGDLLAKANTLAKAAADIMQNDKNGQATADELNKLIATLQSLVPTAPAPSPTPAVQPATADAAKPQDNTATNAAAPNDASAGTTGSSEPKKS